MRIVKLNLKNFRSIKDSGILWLQKSDGITILAGQNESGKSSILKLIYAFETGKLDPDDLVEEDVFPEIEMTINTTSFTISNKLKVKWIDDLVKAIQKLKEVSVIKRFTSISDYEYDYDTESNELLEKFKESGKGKSKEQAIKFLTDIKEIPNKTVEVSTEKIVNGKKVIEVKTEEIPAEKYNSSVDKAIDLFLDSIFYNRLPSIILFSDYADLLPKQIKIEDLRASNTDVNGYKAVKNLESIINCKFSNWAEISDKKRGQLEDKSIKEITADFNEYWKQKISYGKGANIRIQYNQGAEQGAYLNFFVETKSGEWLSPKQRSDGFRWFLSFYLELKARIKNKNNFLILFDEPGLFLHAQAQTDMLKVLEEISNKHQILYTTHSPYLIQEEKLNRVRLVFNVDDEGTTVEKITTSKSLNKKDAIKPVVDAMGLKLATEFSAVKQKNVIVEGISDYYYFQAFTRILGKEDVVEAFVPSMGASNSHLLMELCIGWGLDWLIVFDDKGSKKEFNKIMNSFFNEDEDETKKFIYTISGCDGIEDMFEVKDLCLIDESLKFSDFKDVNNFVSKNGGKELVSRMFLEKVNTGKINDKMLSKKCLDNFGNAFKFFESKFKKA